MEELHAWLVRQSDQRLVEPNSALGGAIRYLQKHWAKRTLFLRVAGAPLDNKICERALKRAILHRKKALFHKTFRGARVGDLFMSLTDFDERNIKYNFDYDYDYAAYEEVKRNLGRSIALGQLRLAMELSRELMDQGIHRVAMSDEGLMTSDIEECLQVVVAALPKSDVPPREIVAWCKAMLASDRVGCIYDRELRALHRRFEASGP